MTDKKAAIKHAIRWTKATKETQQELLGTSDPAYDTIIDALQQALASGAGGDDNWQPFSKELLEKALSEPGQWEIRIAAPTDKGV